MLGPTRFKVGFDCLLIAVLCFVIHIFLIFLIITKKKKKKKKLFIIKKKKKLNC